MMPFLVNIFLLLGISSFLVAVFINTPIWLWLVKHYIQTRENETVLVRNSKADSFVDEL